MSCLHTICGIVLLVIAITHVNTQIVKDTKEKIDTATLYFLKYGYKDTFSTSITEDNVKSFQYFANLPMTGKLDDATMKQMTYTRCGLRDPEFKVIPTRGRSRRFVHQGSRWKKNLLSWKLVGTGRTLRRDTVLEVMRTAFQFWSERTNIDIKELDDQATDEPDIWVRFVVRYHGDPYSFDGQGGTLAHAFYPHNNKGLSGDVHFDDAEEYTYKSPRGRNLLWVAVHELGHSLGLEHSNVRKAIMYPWYTEYRPGFQLNEDDIFGIQSLYGAREKPGPTLLPKISTTTTTTTAPPPTTPKIPDARPCPYGTITAIYYSPHYHRKIAFHDNGDLTLIGFKNLVTRKRRVYIPEFRIPNLIDAALNVMIGTRKYAVYFSGNQYWLYYHIYFGFKSGPHSIYGNDPKDSNPLKLRFPASVKKIDAVMKWKRNGRIYFFADRYYWRFDESTAGFDAGYPKPIKDGWAGLPDRIDSAFSSTLDKKTYFIKGNLMYLYNDYYVRVEGGWPQHVGQGLLDCGGTSSIVDGIGSLGLDKNNLAPEDDDP